MSSGGPDTHTHDGFALARNQDARIGFSIVPILVCFGIWGLTINQLYRSRLIVREFNRHRVKIYTRIFNFIVAICCIVLAFTDIDLWMYHTLPPTENSGIYPLRTALTAVIDISIVFLVCYLAVSLTEIYFKNHINEELPRIIPHIWKSIATILTISVLICSITMYQDNLAIAWMIYIDIRMFLGAFASFFFAYTYYYIDSSRSNSGEEYRFDCRYPNRLQKLTMGLVLFGACFTISGIGLIFSTISDEWKSVTAVMTYSLHSVDNGTDYAIGLLGIYFHWIAHWVVQIALIKWVWSKSAGLFRSTPSDQISNQVSAQISAQMQLGNIHSSSNVINPTAI